MTPAKTNMSAIARSGVVPHHPPNISFPWALASHGMTRNCVRGPTINAVSGEAIFSRDCPNPKTLPCRSRGTIFCMIVCSHASAAGPIIIQRNMPTPVRMILDIAVNPIQIPHPAIERSRRVRTGLCPSPVRATIIPLRINPVLVKARMTPHVSTDTRVRL